MKQVLFLITTLCLSFTLFSQETPTVEYTLEANVEESQAGKTQDSTSANSSKSEVPQKTDVLAVGKLSTESPKPGALKQVSAKVDGFIEAVTATIFDVLFYDLSFGLAKVELTDKDGDPIYETKMISGVEQKLPKKSSGIPLIVATLMLGGIFFTIRYSFINLRLFKHAIAVVRGKFDRPNEAGDVNHFKALTSALSATVGLGNIAMVAIAVKAGGPGAIFWMILAAFFGMASKFSSCTLAQKYRIVNPDGTFSGGPMYYLELALKDKGVFLKNFGSALAVLYALMIMGGALGGGNMFQGSQTLAAISKDFFNNEISTNMQWGIGVAMAALVALVILGGIKRIGTATEFIVPGMCALYVIVSLVIIGSNPKEIFPAVSSIISMAFSNEAMFGGFIGVLIMGVQRAAFSNEAGLGSASIAHAAAKNEEPVMEGVVAMIGPFIDTIIVCSMTGLVIVITDVCNIHPEFDGSQLTSAAWGTLGGVMPQILTVCIVLFAFSTMVSWCYYGERGWIYLVDRFYKNGAGVSTLVCFRVIFVLCVLVGFVVEPGSVLDFSDAMILGMALPNIIGMVILSGKVRGWAKDYVNKLKSGEIAPTK
ncbi:alanine/glycine:cation symporter family protein [Lentisphaera profundi]|uniref:Alanine/glycine:cation symporter family protein n=1 Tax=Lentisphaera profundi TaxID=1658616 RepID=A0ABY7VZF5_9BACT|nr:alanine/glycine:cation symporter family protein [Lentisphaera profundi]WDE98247.1 alanine/glycine:cation symporter family protein [Lentisphaera profundi]